VARFYWFSDGSGVGARTGKNVWYTGEVQTRRAATIGFIPLL
jgi:hypothetical protein